MLTNRQKVPVLARWLWTIAALVWGIVVVIVTMIVLQSGKTKKEETK